MLIEKSALVIVGLGFLALTFTAADISAIIIGVTGLVTALGIVVVNIMTARVAARKIDTATAKIDEVKAKADVIATSVDGATSTLIAKATLLETEVKHLRELLAEKKEATAVLAQVAVSSETALLEKGKAAGVEEERQRTEKKI